MLVDYPPAARNERRRKQKIKELVARMTPAPTQGDLDPRLFFELSTSFIVDGAGTLPNRSGALKSAFVGDLNLHAKGFKQVSVDVNQ